MNAGRPARWRQLALLTVLVLAVHLLLLRPWGTTLAPQRDAQPARFQTRSVPVLPVAMAPAQEPTPQPAPPPAGEAVAPSSPPPPPRAAPTARLLAQATPAKKPVPPRTSAKPLPAGLRAPPPAVLHYEVTAQARGLTLAGRASLEWRHDGQRYEARLELAAPGLRPRVQQSTGAITPDGLAPERFSDRSRGEQATHFDRAAGAVVFSNNRPEAPLVPGMQDRLSVVLQLAMLAAAQPQRLREGTEIAIPTATTREAQDWTFRVLGEETLDLAPGPVRALKLERLPRGEYDQKVELWLAPGQAYAPVRLRLTNPDGGWVDQRWSSTDRP